MKSPFNQRLHTYLCDCDSLHLIDKITQHFDEMRENPSWTLLYTFLVPLYLSGTLGIAKLLAEEIMNIQFHHWMMNENDYNMYDHARFSDDFEQDPFPMGDTCTSEYFMTGGN